MEPEAHMQDREAQRAEHAAIDERIRQEVDGMVAAAAEKREAAFDQFVDRLRAELDAQPPRSMSAEAAPVSEATSLLLAAARAAEDVREASRARALETLTSAREEAELLEAENARRRAALAEELELLRRQAESDAEEIVARARGQADRIATAFEEERRAEIERETALILANAVSVEEERRAKVERETEEILARTRAEAEEAATTMLEERRREAVREADEIRAKAQAEAEHILVESADERQRIRELLSGAIATLDAEATADSQPGTLTGDLASRLPDAAGNIGT